MGPHPQGKRLDRKSTWVYRDAVRHCLHLSLWASLRIGCQSPILTPKWLRNWN